MEKIYLFIYFPSLFKLQGFFYMQYPINIPSHGHAIDQSGSIEYRMYTIISTIINMFNLIQSIYSTYKNWQ